MNLITRVKNILLQPKQEWPVIADEPATVGGLYTSYLMILALIPAAAGFIGLSLIGAGGFGGFSVRVPLGLGLGQAVLGYVLALVLVYVLALVVDALAPSFGGQKDSLRALKVVVYSYTAALVAGVFSLIPMLGILALLGALYSVYLLYTGLPVLMRAPVDKAVGYTVVVVLAGIVLSVITGMVSGAVVGASMFGAGVGPSVSVRTPGGEVAVDTRKLDEMARKMEAAGRQMEEAAKSGDPAAIGKALQQMARSGTGRGPVDAQQLKLALPDTLLDLPRTSQEVSQASPMGLAVVAANARYGAGERTITLRITDAAGMGHLANVAAWAGVQTERTEGGRTERVSRQGDRTVREVADRDAKSAELTIVLANGVIVELDGSQVAPDDLRKASASLSLDRLEALQGAGR